MPNRLARETSPYLQQHADNPVDWYPWGDEALRLAREQNKPILLSIGYSACHWCHVMAHESFEDPEVAALMNRWFVNIKVDREERPDLDQIYQTAHHTLSQRSGGWPLTMFLAPDQRPFFGGTYFPKTPRYNLPGFGDLLRKVEQAYREQGQAIAAQNQELVAHLARTLPPAPPKAAALERAPVAQAVQELKEVFDPQHGGFGGAPKFPHPFELDLCLQQGVAGNDADAQHVALFTLEKMALGGIYDQLGGGFCRYSVDGHWSIPHFEKMLYDNGPLLRLYADAAILTGNELFARVCRETAAWVMREMQSPEGGYYSSLDADSEHEEGKHYVWLRDEVRGLLTEDEYAVAASVYGLNTAPNFEDAQWHLRVVEPAEAAAARLGWDTGKAQALLGEARAKLLIARERRIRPGRDEKILTSWNALMIEGMAHAGRLLGQPGWIDSARRALAFVRGALWRDRKLLATYKDGRAHLNAYLDDYAFLLVALLELLQTDFRESELQFAREVAEALMLRFEDPESGGFFFTSHDHEPLILRMKPGHDNATPSGNGMAAFGLQRLGHLIGEVRYLKAAERTLQLYNTQLAQHPNGFSTLCTALTEFVQPPTIVILRGARSELSEWQRLLSARYRPHTLTVGVPAEVSDLPSALAKPMRGDVNAWVCRGVTCLAPIDSVSALSDALASAVPKARESL